MTMLVLAARTGAADYTFTLLCSAIYWLRIEAGATKDGLPKSLARQFRAAIPSAVAYLKACKIPTREYVKYVDWVESDESDPDDLFVGALETHLKALYAGMANLKRNAETADAELVAINSLRLWHRTSNPNSLEKVRTVLTQLDVPETILEYFKAETKSQAPFVAELKKLVKRLTGTEGTTVPMELREEIRAKKPALWKAYLALRKEINLIYKTELRDLVRSNGGSMNIEDVRKDFTNRSIMNALPKGFKGNIGEDGGLQTTTGVPIDKANQIDPGSKVEMNPNYTPAGDGVAGRNNNWYMKVTLPTLNAKGENNTQYFYTTHKASQQRLHKFGVVQSMLKNEAKIVAKWRRDLKASPFFDVQCLAAQCELTYMTCIRIGGVGNASKDGDTSGLTTLVVGNVKKRGNGLLLEYQGKKNIAHSHAIQPTTVESRKVIEILNILMQGKTRKDLLWTEGKVTLNAMKLRAYFKTVAGPDATPHKIRHMRGTRVALTELTKVKEELNAKKTLSQAMVDTAFQKSMTNVGQMLGHVRGIGAGQKATWQTAVQNYVDPTVQVEFYQDFLDRGIRVPAFLKKFV